MTRAEVSVFRPSSKLAADKLLSGTGLEEAVEFWRELKKAIFDPYRPELHCMRGPGPKCHEKRAGAN